MADRAGFLVQLHGAARVQVQIARRVRRRAQIPPGAVAEFATKRRFDLGMAHQAVRHSRKGRRADLIGDLQPPVAGRAHVGALKLPAEVSRRAEIRLSIQRRNQGCRDGASQPHVDGVIEPRKLHASRSLHRHDLPVAGRTGALLWEVVVLEPRARRCGSVAGQTVGLQFQMHAVGKRRPESGSDPRRRNQPL